MSEIPCQEAQLLIQAELDRELPAAESARLLTHLAACPACAQLQAQCQSLSTQLRAELPRHTAPARLRARLRPRPAITPAAGYATLALAACLAIALFTPRTNTDWPAALTAAHIRALQPGHTLDVISTDRHTVKPWFDGKLPFAPPVKDLANIGFPLTGGRLDYLTNHLAAVLIYKRRQHIIDVFVWPETEGPTPSNESGTNDGYQFRRWRSNGMSLWAVSDLNATELDQFANAWRRHG